MRYVNNAFDEYQQEAVALALPQIAGDITYGALKLAGEAGEVAEKIGKFMRDKPGQRSSMEYQDHHFELAKELGDVLWYVAFLAEAIGIDLKEIATMNIDKLKSRKERGVLTGSGDNR